MPQRLRSQNILLIESGSEIYTTLEVALQDTDYNVVQFGSGMEALAAVPEVDPCIIVADFHTDDWNGKQIFQSLVQDHKYAQYRHIPFVLFSDAQIRERLASDLFNIGLRGWYAKPFGAHEFREVLNNFFMTHEIIQRDRELRQEVKRSEFRYRDLLENANDFIFTLDGDGKFVYLNNRFSPLTGWDKETWIDKKFLTLIDPEDREIALEHYRMAHQGRARVFETKIVRNSPRETILSFNITPIFEKGSIVGSIGIARDVTEQKKMEREIIDLKNFNESIIESMEAGLLTTDLEGQITSLNKGAEKILGWKTENVVGREIKTVLHPEEVDYIFSSLPPGKLPYSRETELTVKTGRRIAIGFTATDRIDNQGEKVGTIVSFRDISEIKQMQTEVIRMDRLASLGVLASGIAHEIKNPLAGIKTMAQACEEEFELEDPRQEYLIRIIRQVNRLDDLLKTFFAFARPKPPDRRHHRISEIIDEVKNLVLKNLTQNGISYTEKITDDLPDVWIDSQQIQQVFLNLILNAIDAMPDGGEFTFSAKPISANESGLSRKQSNQDAPFPYVRVDCSDSGEGIQADKTEMIFDPFFTTKPNGLGLGLSIVYRIIQEHSGDIRVQSKPGQGTTFALILPTGE